MGITDDSLSIYQFVFILTRSSMYDIMITVLANDVIKWRLLQMQQRNYDATHEKILQSGKGFFLELGYEGANLRDICKDAGITTGAFYRHFKDKEDLFSALVQPAYDAFFRVNADGNNRGFNNLDSEMKLDLLENMKVTSRGLVEVIFSNKEDFILLINCSKGTSFEHFVEKVIEVEEEETMIFLQMIIEKGYDCVNLTKQQLHTIMSAQCYALFEVVRHDIEKEEALEQVSILIEFFYEGWKKIFGI